MSNDTDFLRRVPPRDVDTEQVLLSAILLRPEILSALLAKIEVRDFYDPRNERVFAAMVRLISESTPIDAYTLIDALRRTGELAEVGGPEGEKAGTQYLVEIAARGGFPTHAKVYARAIHDLAVRRDFGRTAYDLALKSFEEGDTREFLTCAQNRLTRVYARQIEERPELADVLDEVVSGAGKPDPACLSTGFRDFDDALDGGFGAGQLIVLAGQTSKGKSALALNLAVNFAKRAQGAIFLSLEMPEKQLARRLLFGEAQVSLRRAAVLEESETERLRHARERLRDLHLAIEYRPGLRPLEVRAEAHRRRAEWGSLSLIVVDYVGLAQPDTRQERREREVAAITRDLKLIAGELNCVVIGVTQLNREVDRRESPIPRLSDLRDSGAVEQDADVVAFIYELEGSDNREIAIAKARDGALSWFKLAFRPEMVRFEDVKRLQNA
jgi:replicative DNA helicase